MKTRIITIAVALLMAGTGLHAQDALYSNEFPIGDITLLDGPFKHARDLNIEVLLEYDVDRLLAPFRHEAGLPKKAEYFPNWEGLDGHVGGHYLSAMAMNYAATGNQECLRRMKYMLDELEECQKASYTNCAGWGEGYIGGVPNSANIWSNLKKGDFRLFSSAWVPFYNVHKMFAGLRDAWLYCGDEKAKKLFLGVCDWTLSVTADLNAEQMEQVLRSEHGGMNEILADAYAITGDRKYLEASERFCHKAIMTPLSQDRDQLDNLHANTQVPKAVGFTRVGELNGKSEFVEAGRFFWQTVTSNRSLAFGGNSRREHFPGPSAYIDFITDDEGPETCNTYNMLKLTEALFRIEPKAEYADYYERAMFNHILSTQHPEHGGYVYFTSVRPRHYRVYSAPNEGMWCCVGSGMENHSKYSQFIYTHVGDRLDVNLFVASELKWKEKGITIRQETSFPEQESTKLRIVSGKGKFTLNLRCPGWCDGMEVSVNGKKVEINATPSSYVAIDRKWKKGDVVEVALPMHNSVEKLPNVGNYIAFMHGPIVLGMKTGTEDLKGLIADDGRWAHIASGESLPIDKAPILVLNSGNDFASALKPIPGKPLHFKLDLQMENAIDAELEPFAGIHDSRYMVYWLGLTQDTYKTYVDSLAAIEAERVELDRRSIDKVAPGEQQPEVDHAMIQERSSTGVTNDIFYRDASRSGSFSYLFQTNGETELNLYLKYWGVDEFGTRQFDILIDDELMLQVDNTGRWKTGKFFGVEYAIPASMLEGKKEIRIKFKPSSMGAQIGGLYDIRLLRK